METAPPAQGMASPLDAWTRLESMESPWPGTWAWRARNAAGQEGVLRLMDRAYAGQDQGRALLEAWHRLQRVEDPRLGRPWAAGTASHDGKDVLYVVLPQPRGTKVEVAAPLSRTAGDVAWMACNAAEALAAAHNVGVPHGDVARDALWMEDTGSVHVADIGCCSWPGSAPGPFRKVSAPELSRGGAATFAGDVFALGLLAAGVLCGRERFEAWMAAPDAQAQTAVERDLVLAGVSADLARVLTGALAPDPIARPTAMTFAQQLRPFAVAPVPPGNGHAFQEPAGRIETPAPTPAPQAVLNWLGEKSDPRARLPGAAPDGPAPAAPVETASPSGTSVPPLALPRSVALMDNREEPTLPPPPGDFAGEGTHEIETDAVMSASESMIVKAGGSDPGFMAATESQIMAAVTVPPLTGPDSTPVGLNFSVPRLADSGGADFPLVLRWTERPRGKGRSAVERVAAPNVAPATGKSGIRPGILIAAAGTVGLFFGVGMGRVTAPAPVAAPGALQVRSTLEGDAEVRVELDGRAVGRAPLDLSGITAGPHVVALKADGAEPLWVTVDVRSHETAVVTGAPDVLASRLYVTASRRNLLVARDGADPVPLPAEFDDVEPDSDVKLTFVSGRETLQRVVHVPSGEMTFHLEWQGAPGAAGSPSPGAPPGEATPEAPRTPSPPPPPPPPPPPREAPAGGKSAAEWVADGKRELVAGRFDEAAAAMRKAQQLDPSLPEAAKSLGIVYARTGRACDALANYRRYLELAPAAVDVDRVKTIVHELEEKNAGCP